MERVRKQALAIVATFLLLHLQMAQVTQQRICANQFSLAAQACSLLPTVAQPKRCNESGCVGEADNRKRQQENCCRWLKELDDVCVCSVLVQLPLFLTTPDHNYTVKVGKKCNASFKCDGLFD